MPKYMCSISIKIDKLGVTYIIDDFKNSKFYKYEGDIGNYDSGRIYKIEDMHLYETDDKSNLLQKNTVGTKYLKPTTKIIDGIYICNKIKINLKYKESRSSLLKGKVLLNNQSVRNSLVEVFKVSEGEKEISLGVTTTDENGMYYINLPLNENCHYKIIATHVTY